MITEKEPSNVESSTKSLLAGPVSTCQKHLSKSFDIAIIGGGLSGAYLAYCCARKGLETVIVNYSPLHSHSFMTAISSRTIHRFPLLQEVPGPKRVKSFQIYSPGGKVIGEDENGDGPELLKSVCLSHSDLERFFRETAVRHGAEQVHARVTGFFPENGTWKIKTETGTLRSRVLAGADGVRSIVRRKLSSPFSNKELSIDLGCQVENRSPEPLIRQLMSVPEASVTILGMETKSDVIFRERFSNVKRVKTDLEFFLMQQGSTAVPGSYWAALSPAPASISFFDRAVAGKNWLLIGNAAGHLNPFTGESIHYALRSAELACDAIEAGDTRLFEELWREAYGQELIDSVRLHKALNSRVIDTVAKISSRSRTASYFVKHLLTESLPINDVLIDIIKTLPGLIIESFMSLFDGAHKNSGTPAVGRVP